MMDRDDEDEFKGFKFAGVHAKKVKSEKVHDQ